MHCFTSKLLVNISVVVMVFLLCVTINATQSFSCGNMNRKWTSLQYVSDILIFLQQNRNDNQWQQKQSESGGAVSHSGFGWRTVVYEVTRWLLWKMCKILIIFGNSTQEICICIAHYHRVKSSVHLTLCALLPVLLPVATTQCWLSSAC